MKSIITAFTTFFLMFAMVSEADAKRFGGGGFGKSYKTSPFASKKATPAKKDQQQNPLDGVKLDDVQLHIRPSESATSNFDIAFDAKNIVVSRANRALPSVRLSLLASALNVGEAIDFDVETLLYAWIESGGAMEVQSAQFDSLGFTAKASGPIKVSVDGLLSGKVQVEFLNLDKLPDLVTEVSPRFRKNAEQLATTLKGFTAGNPDDPVIVTLLINNGVVSAGILPIGRIPALF